MSGSSGREISSIATTAVSSNSAVLDIERQHIVEEAERRCRGELEQMRREIDTLKESLKDQVDSEDVRYRELHQNLLVM